MQKEYRLRKSGTFQYVYRRGSSTACKEMVLLYSKGKHTKVGFSVGKKIGNAVTRNLIKRRMKECIRPLLGRLSRGNYVFVAREAITVCRFAYLQKQMLYLLNKQSLYH